MAGVVDLTHLPLDKMAAISQRYLKQTFMNEKFCISIQISLKFVSKSQMHIKTTLIHVMAWRLIGDKPLPEPMLTQFTDTYKRH